MEWQTNCKQVTNLERLYLLFVGPYFIFMAETSVYIHVCMTLYIMYMLRLNNIFNNKYHMI